MTKLSIDWRTDLAKLSPEFGAGQFASDDQTVEFYVRCNSLIPDGGRVVDFGAGRGKNITDMPDDFVRTLMTFSLRNATYVAVDVDEAVNSHPYASETISWMPGSELSIQSGSADMIISHWVLEHVDDVDSFVSEVYRVLKPGGWFCARTVNKWSYVGLNRIIRNGPTRRHLLNSSGQHASLDDNFPVTYKINTSSDALAALGVSRFRACVITRKSRLRYGLGQGRILFWTFRVLHSIPWLSRTDLLIYAQKI